MPSLSDVQSAFRGFLVAGERSFDPGWFEGGPHAVKRLGIHRRNYESSLVKAFEAKFPATAWLVGPEYLAAAARQFVHQHPPEAPCIAEYGRNFPRFLASLPGSLRLPYLNDFAQLEWCVGQVSIAVSEPELDAANFNGGEPFAFIDSCLELQSGLFYFQAAWPVDELLKIYLSGDAPERLEFNPEEVFLEVRGARGGFGIGRLGRADFTFRRAVLEGRSIQESAALASEAGGGFEARVAIRSLMDDGLATRVVARGQSKGEES